MTNKELCIWLSSIKGIGNKKTRAIREYFNDLVGVYVCPVSELKSIKELCDSDIENILMARKNEYIEDNVYRKLEDLNKRNIRYVDYYSADYPDRLKNIYDSPLGLYVSGKLPPKDMPMVAVVGARNCSEYGRSVAKELSKQLASMGVGIISGMARGIDVAAHMGAVNGKGATYAVLGCGIDRCYPPENINAFMECIECGGVISEYGVGVLPMAANFPMRNRIISGMSDIILVVEAKSKSGSLITADMALEQGKSVMAVPGRIIDVMSQGCNNLIYNGGIMVLSVMDIISELNNCGFKITDSGKKDGEFKNITLATSEKMVYDRLCLVPKSIKCVMEECNMGYQKVVEILIKLELMDIIVQTSKGWYAKVQE